MSSFVHLHNHTTFSLLDGACRIKDLVAAAKEFKMPAVAVTDHGNMFGVVRFYKEAIKAGLRPIIGMEAYVAPESRKLRRKGEGEETAFHLILLAKDMAGYRNLSQLSSIGFLEGFYYKPRIDKEALQEHAEGLIVLSSCIKGEVSQRLLAGDMEGARRAAGFYQGLFKENYYLEVQNHGIPEEEKANQGLFALSEELGIPVVATNDTHYLKKEHAEAQDVLLCIQTNRDLEDPKRLKFRSDQMYFKNRGEMEKAFPGRSDLLGHSLEIAEKCHVVFEEGTHHFPQFQVPPAEGPLSLEEYFEQKCWEGARRRYADLTPAIRTRMTHEMDVIRHMGFTAYFLITMDFIEKAREKGIPVGPGRGTAAGSIVSYCLGITNVDPLRYNLLFERFLNPERVSMPDIDIDFCYERREEVIAYVREKYGSDNVSQIITFGSMNARAVIRDVGRVLKIPYGEVDQIAKLIPFNFELGEAYDKIPEFKEICDKNETNRRLLSIARILEGLARHASIHAAGVVIAPGDLRQYVPLFKSTQGDITTQYDMKSLEQAGLLKMDFLGLRTLTVIADTQRALSRKGVSLDTDRIPLNDAETYRVFSGGETVGIFQFESAGMRDYLRKLHPESIEDLTAMNALYRPGPMQFIDDFISRKHGRTPIAYLHRHLEPILKETHGVIVYQEQVMQIASDIGGFSLAEADILRRAMGKKDIELMEAQRTKFIAGAAVKGVPADAANAIFEDMNKFSGYGFNKSHAVCYSIVAYQTAYLKAHHPVEFLAANLTSEMGDTDRVVVLVEECKRMGIPIHPPDINRSAAELVAEGDGIRFGLGGIKNVGQGAIESIVAARRKLGAFPNLFDFCSLLNLRLVNKKVLESLIRCGAMDSLEGNRAQKMAMLERAIAIAQDSQDRAGSGQTSMFGEDAAGVVAYPPLPALPEWPPADILRSEKELLGIYISGHPLEKFRDDVQAFSKPPIAELDQVLPGEAVRVCGIVTDVQTRLDKKDKLYARFTLEDFTGSIQAIAFSDVYEKFRALIAVDQLVVLNAKADRREERNTLNLVVSDLLPLSDARPKYAKRVFIRVDAAGPADASLDRMKEVLLKYPGNIPVYFHVSCASGKDMHLRSKKFRVNPVQELIEELRSLVEPEKVCIDG